MRYTIETTEKGCKETLLIQDTILGEIELVREHERTNTGCRCVDNEFHESLEKYGYSEEVLNSIYNCFDSFFAMDFIRLAEELDERNEG